MAVVIPKEYTGTVVAKEWLSPKIMYLSLQPTTPIPFIPGQYGSLLLDIYRRPLSFASLPQEETVSFIVDISPGGVCSTFTKNCSIGDSVRVLAPYGRFTVTPTTRPLLFIATGSGIAPIRSQLKHVLGTLNATQPIQLFFGNRNEEYMFLNDEFSALAATYSNFTFTPVLSEPSASWSGVKGLVTTVIPKTITDLPNWDAYLCGNPSMIKDMTQVLLSQGVAKDVIHTEAF